VKKGEGQYENSSIGLFDDACGCAGLERLRIPTEKPNHADACSGCFRPG
jgi:hypothetical protein